MMARIGLVGCVSEKLNRPALARDLYRSALFVGRRRYVEGSCDDWFILSAKHGLVRQDEVLEPYDQALTGAGRAIKRAWAGRVIEQLVETVGSFDDTTFEVHAGADYFGFGLEAGLIERGGRVEVPTLGLRVGEQLQFYARRSPWSGHE
jgi:hypothetical protein